MTTRIRMVAIGGLHLMTKDFYFDCPYCHEHTAYPHDGWLNDDNEELTRWICEGKCGAEWEAWGHDTPDLEYTILYSPRWMPDDDKTTN